MQSYLQGCRTAAPHADSLLLHTGPCSCCFQLGHAGSRAPAVRCTNAVAPSMPRFGAYAARPDGGCALPSGARLCGGCTLEPRALSQHTYGWHGGDTALFHAGPKHAGPSIEVRLVEDPGRRPCISLHDTQLSVTIAASVLVYADRQPSALDHCSNPQSSRWTQK
jgi:hypothetical protein